jgi:hypothetical protein
MAGTDTGAHAWTSKYDPLCRGRNGASGLMECAPVAVVAAGQVTDLLHATAVARLVPVTTDSRCVPTSRLPEFCR